MAAAQEVDVAHFRETGEVLLLPSALDMAQQYVAANTGHLTRNGIAAHIADITVDQALRQVEVTVVADISSLFPAWVPRAVISGRGTAEVRGMVR